MFIGSRAEGAAYFRTTILNPVSCALPHRRRISQREQLHFGLVSLNWTFCKTAAMA